MTQAPTVPDEVGGILAELATQDTARSSRAARARLLAVLARRLGRSARVAGVAAVASGRWLADTVIQVAPRVPVRDAATLRRQYPGLTTDGLADRLVTSAARHTAAVGAASGAVASVDLVNPPLLLTAPVQLAAETLAVVAIEVKLVAELHELYGRPALGNGAARGNAYVRAWAGRRGLEATNPGGMVGTLSGTARRQLQGRLLRRTGRNVTSLAPFLTGAVAAAELNRRETRRLGERLIADLR